MMLEDFENAALMSLNELWTELVRAHFDKISFWLRYDSGVHAARHAEICREWVHTGLVVIKYDFNELQKRYLIQLTEEGVAHALASNL